MFVGSRATFSIPQRDGGLRLIPLGYGVAVSLHQFSYASMFRPAPKLSPSFRTWMSRLLWSPLGAEDLVRLIDACAAAAGWRVNKPPIFSLFYCLRWLRLLGRLSTSQHSRKVTEVGETCFWRILTLLCEVFLSIGNGPTADRKADRKERSSPPRLSVAGGQQATMLVGVQIVMRANLPFILSTILLSQVHKLATAIH